MSYYCFNRKELLQKAKGRYHNCGGKKKKKLLSPILKTEGFKKKKQNVSVKA